MIARILFISGERDGHIEEHQIQTELEHLQTYKGYIVHDFVSQGAMAGQGCKYDPDQPRLFLALPLDMRFLEACIRLVERYSNLRDTHTTIFGKTLYIEKSKSETEDIRNIDILTDKLGF